MADAVVTKIAKNKMMRARAGEITLPKIVGMAFGDSGVDSAGKALTPSESQTALNNEIFRKELESHTILSDTKCRYTVVIASDEMVGSYISEMALYDEDGDLVAIKNFLKKGKDSDLEMTIHMDDEF